jgi:hypothetical protein
VRLEVVALGEERLVGRDQRDSVAVGIVDQLRLGGRLLPPHVALQFDVEPVAEQLAKPVEALVRVGVESVGEERVDSAFGAAGQADDAGDGIAVEPGQLGGGLAVLALEISAADEAGEIGEALFARGHEDHGALAEAAAVIGAARLRVAELERQLAAEQRLNTLPRRLLGELERTEQVVGVRDAERRLLVGLGQFQQLAERQRALEQRVGGVDVKVDEAWTWHGLTT